MRLKDLIPFGERQGQELVKIRDPFTSLRREIDSLFDRTFTTFPNLPFGAENISIDVIDRDKELLIKADIPGIAEEDVSVHLLNDVLTIQGEKKQEKKKEKENYYMMERSYGNFIRSITLPFRVEPSKVDAEVEKGVLSIKIPKSQEAMESVKEIKIKRK